MNPLDLNLVNTFVINNITRFPNHRIQLLKGLQLDQLIKKNPYLLKANNIQSVSTLVTDSLNAFLSSSEEKLFGDFFEDLAIYIAELTTNGHKSTAQGVDLEFLNKDIYYVVSIKSGPNWGNSSQQAKLEQDFKDAVRRLKQSNRSANIQPVLGICYGKTKSSFLRGYWKVVGQNFWYLISENPNLYTDIIEPIGFRAPEFNEAFYLEKCRIENRFTMQFMNRFCDDSGAINWNKLVEFNSGNFDPSTFEL